MKIEKIETIKTPVDVNITGARLLTKEEAEALPERLRLYHDWWWTSSANTLDNTRNAFFVFGNNGDVFSVSAIGADAARPALIFESSSLKIGDRISVAGLEFEVIADGLAFCLGDIGRCAFRKDWKVEDANQYEKSDIKKFVDKWVEEMQNESR